MVVGFVILDIRPVARVKQAQAVAKLVHERGFLVQCLATAIAARVTVSINGGEPEPRARCKQDVVASEALPVMLREFGNAAGTC